MTPETELKTLLQQREAKAQDLQAVRGECATREAKRGALGLDNPVEAQANDKAIEGLRVKERSLDAQLVELSKRAKRIADEMTIAEQARREALKNEAEKRRQAIAAAVETKRGELNNLIADLQSAQAQEQITLASWGEFISRRDRENYARSLMNEKPLETVPVI